MYHRYYTPYISRLGVPKMSTAKSYEQQGLLHDMFARQAKKTPNAMAVVDEDGRKVTFKELNDNSDILAKHFVQIGVTPNACVGMYLNKSIEYATVYIAILKAG